MRWDEIRWDYVRGKKTRGYRRKGQVEMRGDIKRVDKTSDRDRMI